MLGDSPSSQSLDRMPDLFLVLHAPGFASEDVAAFRVDDRVEPLSVNFERTDFQVFLAPVLFLSWAGFDSQHSDAVGAV